MRSYIKFWAQKVNLTRTVDGATTILTPVAGSQEELEDEVVYSVNYTNEGTAGNPYDDVSREDPFPVWFEMNKEAVLILLRSMYPYSLGVFQPYPAEETDFSEFVVYYSPRDSWTHGH